MHRFRWSPARVTAVAGALVIVVSIGLYRVMSRSAEPVASTKPPVAPPPALSATAPGGATVPTEVKFRSDAWNLPDEPLLGLVEIPAGPFLMGSDKTKDPRANDDERWGAAGGQGRLELPTYYMERYEVTVAQFKVYVETTKIEPGDARSIDGPGDRPVRFVSWHEAIA